MEHPIVQKAIDKLTEAYRPIVEHLAVGMDVYVNDDVALYGGEAGTIVGWNPDGRYVVHLDAIGRCEFWPHEITIA